MSKIFKGHLNFKLRDSPFGGSEKYQPAYGNMPATLLLLVGRLVTSLVVHWFLDSFTTP
jgi:hypothetical protein